MSFAALHQTQRQLSLRLRVHAGEKAYDDINVTIPTKDDDELSFLRLVVWCYVAQHEAGRVALRFLKELPPIHHRELLLEVGYLRTWATHNLMSDRDSDRKKLQLAWGWLRAACGTSSPTTQDEWRACFVRLSEDMNRSLTNALTACEVLADPEDGPPLLDELHRRLDRNWDAFRFDAYVVDGANRLGFDGVDPVALRKYRLDSWRAGVASAEEAAIVRLIEQRIEKDLLDLMNDALPVRAREVLERVSVEDPKELGALMLALRTRSRSSRRGVGELLDGLVDYHRSAEVMPPPAVP